MPDCAFTSRHLGSVTAGEITNLQAIMERLSEAAEQHIDLDAYFPWPGVPRPLRKESFRKRGQGRPNKRRSSPWLVTRLFAFTMKTALTSSAAAVPNWFFSAPCMIGRCRLVTAFIWAAAILNSMPKTSKPTAACAVRSDRPCKEDFPALPNVAAFMYLHQAFRGDDGTRYAWSVPFLARLS